MELKIPAAYINRVWGDRYWTLGEWLDRRAAEPHNYTIGGFDMAPSGITSDVKTEYKYAVESKVGGYGYGRWVEVLHSGGHFGFMAKTIDDALLFDSATEAEEKTAAGRKTTSSLAWVIVPVKITTSTTTKTVRSLA